jgi:hypothetical protein
MRRSLSLLSILGLGLLFMVGCSPSSVSSGGTPISDPTANPQSSSVQESSVMSSAGRTMDEAGMKVFTDAMEPSVVVSPAPISVSQHSRQSALPLGCILPLSAASGISSPSSALTFPSTVNATVNLDATSGGVDLFPFATGTLTLVGRCTLFNPLGSASYTITMTASSTVACTDPASGWTASVPSGTTRTMNLNVAWQGVGPLQNTMTLSATGAQTAHPLTLTKGATTLRGYVISENWTGGFTRVRNIALVYRDLSFTGTRIVEWTNSSNATIRVTWDVKSLNEIYLTVKTVLYEKTYGPYTALQIRTQFGTTIE